MIVLKSRNNYSVNTEIQLSGGVIILENGKYVVASAFVSWSLQHKASKDSNVDSAGYQDESATLVLTRENENTNYQDI